MQSSSVKKEEFVKGEKLSAESVKFLAVSIDVDRNINLQLYFATLC